MYERAKARADAIQQAHPDMHPHRAFYLAEQELSPEDYATHKAEQAQRTSEWLAQEARKPRTRAPQHLIDIHIRNGWDID